MKRRTIMRRRAAHYQHLAYNKSHEVKLEEVYSLDYTLVEFMLPRLKLFKEKTCSYPASITMEEWQTILQDIIDGWELFIKTDEWDTPQTRLADQLFFKYFHELWW